MSNPLHRSVTTPSRASKIQIKVREIAQPVSQKTVSAKLDVDADGGDISRD